MRILFILIFLLSVCFTSYTQVGVVRGQVSTDGEAMPLVTIQVSQVESIVFTDENGYFEMTLPYGAYEMTYSFVGFRDRVIAVDVSEASPVVEMNVELESMSSLIDEIVVTGTRTFQRRTESPIMVNVVDDRMLKGVQACNMADGLRFQPGLRVETDCQTCNYTQLRLNGLGGGYTQILVNGRPVFSPLTGLYGLEQIPSNMVDRIEIVRGGGSSLYGSSAIGGTVNLITRLPEKNTSRLSMMYSNIDGQSNDWNVSGNTSIVNESKSIGATVYLNTRHRGIYDYQGDGYSELPELQNFSWGASAFYKPDERQKLELSLANLNEDRYGGEIFEGASHEAGQAEDREHHVWMGNIDYQVNSEDGRNSLILYASGQRTVREHFTGVRPDDPEALEAYLENPPYGDSENGTWQVGLQYNFKIDSFLGGNHIYTVGSEYLSDAVLDVIDSYNYIVDQQTRNLGLFVQDDWRITQNVNLLLGVRMDEHNLLQRPAFSPRASLLYRLKSAWQFRLTYGQGFRAPQAFDADLHIAFAGGGISRVSLDPSLQRENSASWSTSINYDKVTEHWIAGFTLEGFSTRLRDAFVLDPIGQDAFGEVFIKRNGQGSRVQGVTLELRGNYDQKWQLEAGYTWQLSEYDEAIEFAPELPARTTYMRTPNQYGYAVLAYFPNERWRSTLNLVYTGTMELVHFGGAPEQLNNAYVTSPRFTELSFRSEYAFDILSSASTLRIFGGVKNMTNAYQSDFDSGKNRDSNYVYGPGAPRTFFLGVELEI